MSQSPNIIKDPDALRELCGDFHPHVSYKIQQQLSEQAQSFIRMSPFVLLSTISETGEPTISPKGGSPGFVGFDANMLYLPDKRGNNLIFSLQNILVNPNVSLIFLVPGTCETLRVQGKAQITNDQDLCVKYPLDNKAARLVTIIEVSSAYFHCSLSLRSAKLWQPESWTDAFKVSWRKEIEPNLVKMGEDYDVSLE